MISRLRPPAPIRWTLAFLLAAAPFLAFAADAPGATELEFWRSSDRIGTANAYQAYLDAYPRGTFAPLARAGIEKSAARAPVPVAAPAVVPAERAEPAASLRPFSEEATGTSAIPFMIGDRFTGPGAVIVGWSGAKKQILLPPGTWYALAGVDYKSEQASPFTSISVPVRGA